MWGKKSWIEQRASSEKRLSTCRETTTRREDGGPQEVGWGKRKRILPRTLRRKEAGKGSRKIYYNSEENAVVVSYGDGER